MRVHWVSAAVLSSALVAGCGDRGSQNTENTPPNAAPAATAPADQTAERGRDQVSPDRDTAARPADTRPDTRPRSENRRESARSVDRAPSDSRDFNGSSAPNRTPSSSASTSRTAEFRELTVPAGTALPLELMTALSSETAHVETPVRARLRNAVLVNGVTALPAGTIFNGTVTEVSEAGRVKGRSHLAFRFDDAEVRGVRERLRTNPVVFEGEATKSEDATKIGAGAGIGAAIGGILGGGKGAAKGAAIGGAAGTGAVLATRGKEVTLAEGADISATLSDSVSVRVPER